MTTTPDKTPEEIFKAAWHEADERGEKGSRVAAGIAALRAAGLLVGDPTEERGAECDRDHTGICRRCGEGMNARKLLDDAAGCPAGVAPQAHAKELPTSPGRMKNEADSFNVAPQEPSEKCTCPSGDGSLRWPCPSHPPAPQEPSESRQCGPCRRGQHGCCDGNEYVRCDDLHSAPSTDREKLIANAEDWLRNGSPLGPRRIIRSLIDALAAQPVLDERKVAEVIEQMRDRSRKERDVAKESLGQFIARALCEAAKRGELSA